MLPLDKTRNLNTIICDPQATVSGMCGTGIIIQGRIVHESILRKKALSGTEMIPKQYSTPLRHRILVGLHMENKHLLGIYLTSGTILNPDLPSGSDFTPVKKPVNKGFSPLCYPLRQQKDGRESNSPCRFSALFGRKGQNSVLYWF